MTQKQIKIVEVLFANAKKISFGSVAVELKIHAGKCVGVIHTTSENLKQKESRDDII